MESKPFERGTAALVWLRATMWLAAAVPLVLFALVAVYLHQRAIAQAQLHVDSRVRVGEEHALKVVENNIALLSRVGDLLGSDSDDSLRAREREVHEQLVRMSAGLRQLQGIFVTSSSGRLLVTNRTFPAPHTVDITDRAYYRHHLAGGAQPYFTELLTSRATGEPFFDMSVRHTAADGRLSALLSASMTPRYFADFYSELAGNDRDVNVALVHADGAVLAGWPHTPVASDAAGAAPMRTAAGASAGGDALAPAARAEGEARIRAERSVGLYPLRVVAWMDRSAALADWYREMAVLAAFAFPSSLVLIYVAWVALQRTRRSLQIHQSLEEETAQRRRIEEALRNAQKLEALGRLAGGVAHDFNNLLMVVNNNLYLQRKREPSLAASPQLAAIERAVTAGTKLTRQLLSFSRRQPLRPERVRLQDHLSGMLDLLAPALGAAISVDAHVEPDTAPIEVDVAELELAVLNLAINSRDAMPAGGRLHITAANASAADRPGLEGSFVVISVSDSGQGIAPEHLERVFEPFFTTKELGHGTGLGLSQVYGFCVRAGGTATLDSRIGLGTRVRLYFPAAAQIEKPPSPAPAATFEALRGVRVLLVEDNDEVAATTVGVLDSMGCKVRRLADADTAIEVLRASACDFDLLLSDIVMIGAIDGIGLAKHVLEAHPALPLLLMSGYSASIEGALALGVDVLPKPCTPQALSSAMRGALARKKVPGAQAA